MNILTKEQFCEKYNLTSLQFKGKEWIKRNLTIDEEFLPDGFNPRVVGNLSLPNLKIIPIWFNPVVMYDLELPSVISFESSFDPVVGMWIRLNSLTEIPFGWKPMTWCLYLPLITTLPDWFEPTVWKVWFDSGNDNTNKFSPANEFYSWRDGKYLAFDDFIVEVVRNIGQVYRVQEFGSDKRFYLVTDGNGVFAEGDTLNHAKENLTRKLV